MKKFFLVLACYFVQTHYISAHNLAQDRVVINNKTFVPYITEDQIKQRIQEVGQQITRDYAGKNLLLVGVLNGSAIILSDLIREINLDCEMDFLKISSYGNGTQSSGTITLEKNLSRPITGRDVIIVEDIIDSGLSIEYVRNLLMQSNPKSLKVFSLLVKRETAKVSFPIDYVGFDVPSKFVIGCGLDYAQKGRNLKSIYALAQN